MIKLLIADDEQPVLEGVQFLVKKHFQNLEVCATAQSGREAIEKVKQFRPDIVIMDVRMPGMSGLDAVRELRQSFPKIIYILLTAYERFEIAKEAIDLNIFDYLLKPLNREELIQVLQKSLELLSTQFQAKQKELEFKDWKEEASVFLEQTLIFHCTTSDTLIAQGVSEKDSLADMLNLERNNGVMAVFQWVCKTPEETLKTFQHFRESLKFKLPCAVGALKNSLFSIYIPWEKELDCPELPLSEIPLSVEWKAGFGSLHSLWDSQKSYEEALEALVDTPALQWSFYQAGKARQPNSLHTVEKSLIQSINSSSINQMTLLTQEIWTAWIKDDHEHVDLKAREFLALAEQFKTLQTGETPSTPLKERWSTLTNQKLELAVKKDIFLDLLKELSRQKVSQEKLSLVVEKTIQFLNKHFMEPISLDDAAKDAKVHPHYLSRIFSQENGESFVDYLTKLRMNKAKELLLQGASVKEASGMLGYGDANYFSRLFKKREGINPGDFVRERRFV